MNVSLRRLGWLFLGMGVLLGPLSAQAHAQRVPIGIAPNPGIAPARGLSGLATASTLASGAPSGLGALGGGLGRGLGYGGLGRGLGYGSLTASYARSGLGARGYGLGGGAVGLGLGLGGYGLGGYFGTQWMLNPYSGYLQGAASITNANAQYQLTIQQARLTREDARRSRIATRRAWIEEAEYERAHMPDPEKIRQEQLARELDRARVSPPSTEIWSGRSLNSLLRHLIAQQGQGVRGPTQPLDEGTLNSINFTVGDTRGNVGLLKDKGKLYWPHTLRSEAFKQAREDFSAQMGRAVDAAQFNKNPDDSTINDMQADLRKLYETLDARVGEMSLSESIDARRYLRLLSDTVTALKDRNVSNYLSGNWKANSKTVAELIKFMAEKGLWFAAATPDDRAAYSALYYKLAAFDAGMPRSGSNGSSGFGYGANR